METVLSLIRRDAEDDRPDMWVADRMELGLKSAMRSIARDKEDEALAQIESVVKLLENTMKITDEILLPTSCRYLDGMEWRAKEDWTERSNNPDSPVERFIYIYTEMNRMSSCYCIFPSQIYDDLSGKNFDPLRDHPSFVKLCERVKALIVIKQKEA